MQEAVGVVGVALQIGAPLEFEIIDQQGNVEHLVESAQRPRELIAGLRNEIRRPEVERLSCGAYEIVAGELFGNLFTVSGRPGGVLGIFEDAERAACLFLVYVGLAAYVTQVQNRERF